MILSKFNIYYDIVGKSSKVAVFNTLSKQIACFDRTVLDNIHDIPYVSDFPLLYYLKKMNIVTDTLENDKMLVKKLHDKISEKSYKLYLVVIPTYKCNLKCQHCSTPKINRDDTMSDETFNATIDFINRFSNISYMDFVIKGGEPLLLKQGLFEYIQKYYDSQKGKNITSNVCVMTNGTLLTLDTITQLEDKGVTSIIIDLEGLQDTYIARKNFIDGKGAYSALLETVMMALVKTKKIIFTFNVCYEQENLPETMLFLNSLQTVLNNKRIKFSIHQLSYNSKNGSKDDKFTNDHKNTMFDKNGNNNINNFSEFDKCTKFNDSPEKMPTHKRVRVEKKEVDITSDVVFSSECVNNMESSIHSRYGVCHAKGDWMFAVDPKGDIFKCINGVGMEQFKIGNVKDDISLIYTAISKWNNHVMWCKSSGCVECKMLPLCFGGCLYEQHLNIESQDSFDCQKKYFMSLIKTKVSKYIRSKVTEIQDIKC